MNAMKAHGADMAALGALGRVVTGLLGGPGGDASYGALKHGLRDTLRRDPLDSLAVIVLGGSYLFYVAEKGKNPKCTSFWDALVFITTCLSVGYDDVFAKTDAGKALASFVMTFGPALTAAALEAPEHEKAEEAKAALAVQKAILARLDDIHTALSPSAPPA